MTKPGNTKDKHTGKSKTSHSNLSRRSSARLAKSIVAETASPAVTPKPIVDHDLCAPKLVAPIDDTELIIYGKCI